MSRGTTDALRRILDGVFVVTTKEGEHINGMTAVWATRASFNPPMISVSIGKSRYTHGLITKSGVFALNVLAEGQIDIGKRFGFRSGQDTDKFKGLEHTAAETGSPILPGVSAYLDCRVRGACDAGDHTIFVGEVVDSASFEGRPPLLYRHEDFF